MPARDPDARRTPRIDFATAPWERNEFGVGMLWLSRDAGNGGVSFALRTPADFHPRPWTGHYLVDRAWNPRPERPYVLSSGSVPWQPSGLHAQVAVRPLHGTPGRRRPDEAVFTHSPWAADFTLMLRVEAGYRGPMPGWDGFFAESLACAGRARIGGEPWHRGCYQFDGPGGACRVEETLELYCRYFREPTPAPRHRAGWRLRRPAAHAFTARRTRPTERARRDPHSRRQ